MYISFLSRFDKSASIMTQQEKNTTLPIPAFMNMQREIDRILEKAGAIFYEQEVEEIDEINEIETLVVKEEMTLNKRNNYIFTKYPAVFHGKYSIPKTWVSDEEVAKAVIIEDGKEAVRTKGVLYFLYREFVY